MEVPEREEPEEAGAISAPRALPSVEPLEELAPREAEATPEIPGPQALALPAQPVPEAAVEVLAPLERPAQATPLPAAVTLVPPHFPAPPPARWPNARPTHPIRTSAPHPPVPSNTRAATQSCPIGASRRRHSIDSSTDPSYLNRAGPKTRPSHATPHMRCSTTAGEKSTTESIQITIPPSRFECGCLPNPKINLKRCIHLVLPEAPTPVNQLPKLPTAL